MLSRNRQLEIKEAVISIGYTENMIRDNFSFLGCKGKTTADMIAFGSTRHFDLETACLGIHFPDNGNRKIIEDFKMIAIPYVFLAYSDNIQIWSLNTDSPTKITEKPYSRINEFFSEHRSKFSPNSILKAKEQGCQLSFANLDLDMGLLYEWGFNATREKLKKNLETAIENAKNKLSEKQFDTLSKISIKLIGACILQDKGYLGTSYNDAIELLESARKYYPNHFSSDDTRTLKEEVLEGLLKDIRAEGCIFTNLTTEMLDHLYQYAFVTDESWRKLGIYPTPPKLSRMIANNLPFEDIRPEKLFLLDGTCGSGSLLVAGHKRLYNLLPISKSEDEKYRYLSEHILGIDDDSFASDIAQLSLLHESLPCGNLWNIKTKNFIKTDCNDFPASPSIILANPPYSQVRKGKESNIEKAIPFVEKNLDLLCDGGLMAIILPETFLQKSSCKDSRKRILDECEILETWQLPEGIFEESSSATTVLFLRKNMQKPKSFPVRIKRVLNKDKKEFLNKGITNFSYIFPDQSKWESEKPDFQFIPNIFDELWKRLSKFQKLGDIATIKNGIKPGKGREDHFCNDNPPEGWKKWLNGPSALRHFLIDWENQKIGANQYINYPIRCRKALDLKRLFEAENKKIIMNARMNPNARWRIRAAIDDKGYFPSYYLFVLFDIKNNLTLEELTSVLNHTIANAWSDDHIRAKYFHKSLLNKLPIPEFNKFQKKNLEDLVRQLMNKPADSEYQGIIRQIDDIVDSAYGLSEEEKLRLKAAGFVREGYEGEFHTAKHKKLSDKTWIVTGIVEDIDANNNLIQIWFSGFGEDSVKIPIPREMPGWAIRPDVAFEAEIPFEHRYEPDWNKLQSFRPVRYSYMTEEELLESLNERV